MNADTGRGLVLSAIVTGAVFGLIAFLLSGCVAGHPVRAARLFWKARPMDCRSREGVPVSCPLKEGDDGL